MSLKTPLQKTHLNYVVSRACTPGHLALRHHVQAQPRPLAAMLLVIVSAFTSIYDHGITTVRSNKLQRGSRVCVHRSAGILAGLRGKCLRHRSAGILAVRLRGNLLDQRPRGQDRAAHRALDLFDPFRELQCRRARCALGCDHALRLCTFRHWWSWGSPGLLGTVLWHVAV